jgi:hypothetical protein
MRFGQDDAKGHRKTVDIPGDDQQSKANTEKPVLVLGVSPFLSDGTLLGAFGFMANPFNMYTDLAKLLPHLRASPYLAWR